MIDKRRFHQLTLSVIYLLGVLGIVASGGGGGGSGDDSPDAPEFNVTVSDAGIKTIRFDWASFNGSTNYKLFVNPDGASGYSLLQDNLVGTSTTVEIEAIHFTDWVNASYILEAHDDTGYVTESSSIFITPLMISSIGYFKASNTNDLDLFGGAVSLSADGNTLAVGAREEASNATGIDGDQADNSAFQAGAVYVFTRSGNTWTQQAYVKASNTNGGDGFGDAVSLSADGNTLAVGATGAGAVYVFTRSGNTWSQQASNTGSGGFFGRSVSLSDDGNTLAVGANGEGSGAGAVYVFTRSGNTWSQQAYVKASNTESGDFFGRSVSLSDDGNTLAVGAHHEDSNATGIDGDQADNSAASAGAVYVFIRSGITWSQLAYVKASNTNGEDWFGFSVSLSDDGNTLAVGANYEDSNGIDAGAAYVFTRSGNIWSQQAYVKASNTGSNDHFGWSVSLSDDGNTLAVGANDEDSNATGIDGDQADSTQRAGAVYVFTRSGNTWSQQAYVKASNTDGEDHFGASVSLSADGNTLAVGANYEGSNATGIDGDQADNSAVFAGAVYIY